MVISENLEKELKSTKPLKLSLVSRIKHFFWKRKFQKLLSELYTAGGSVTLKGSLKDGVTYSFEGGKLTAQELLDLTNKIFDLMLEGHVIFGGDPNSFFGKIEVVTNENT